MFADRAYYVRVFYDLTGDTHPVTRKKKSHGGVVCVRTHRSEVASSHTTSMQDHFLFLFKQQSVARFVFFLVVESHLCKPRMMLTIAHAIRTGSVSPDEEQMFMTY